MENLQGQLNSEQSVARANIHQDLDDQLEAFIERFNPDVTLAHALASSSSEVCRSGIPEVDEARHKDLSSAKLATIRSVTKVYELVYDKAFVRESQASETVPPRRDRRRTQRKHHSSDCWRNDHVWTEQSQRNRIDQAEKEIAQGIHQNTAAKLVSDTNGQDFITVLGLLDDYSVYPAKDYRYGTLYVNALSEGVPSSEMTMADVITAVEERGSIDRTKPALDARAEVQHGIVQIAATELFLWKLTDLAQLGRSRRKLAATLASQYREDLFSDNYDRKVEMLTSLGFAFDTFASKEHHPETKRVLSIFAQNACNVGLSMETLRYNFMQVYSKLGFEAPAFLSPAEEVSAEPTVPNKTVSLAAGTIAVGSSKDTSDELTTEQSREALRSQVETVNVAIKEFNSQWQLSAAKRRKLGFDTMQGELVKGFVNYARTCELAPFTKENAQHFIDTLVRLNSLAQSKDIPPAAIRAHLEDQRSQQVALEYNRTALVSQLVGHQVSHNLTKPHPLAEQLQWVKSEWSAVRQIIDKTWPKLSEKSLVIERLNWLLFSQTD